MAMFEQTGTASMRMSASGVREGGGGASAAMGVAKEFTVQPPSPHHAYDSTPNLNDPVAAVLLCFATVFLCAVWFVVRWRGTFWACVLHPRGRASH